MYKSILIPIALHPARDTQKAIEAAKFLSAKDGGILAIHVQEPIPNFAETYVTPEFEAERMQVVKGDFKKMMEGSGITGEIIHGRAASSILEYAEQNDIDCIVVASHQHGFSDYFIGSTASRIVSHAKCAVHVVR